MKHERILVVIVGLFCALLFITSLGKAEKQKDTEKTPDRTHPSCVTSVFRFPEHHYFVVPKAAHTLTILCAKPADQVTAVTLYEYPMINPQCEEIIAGAIVSSKGGEIPIEKWAGKKLFALVKIARDRNSDTESPFLRILYRDAKRQLIHGKSYEHTTGWVTVGYKTPCEVIFQSYSPILSFSPLLRPRKQGELPDACSVGEGLCDKPDAGLRYSYLSPFRIMVYVPPFKKDYLLAARMHLADGFSKNGDIFVRRVSTKETTSFYRATKHSRIISTSESRIPPETRKIMITLIKPYAPASFKLILVTHRDKDKLPLSLKPIRSFLTEIIEVPGPVKGIEGYVFEYDLSKSLKEPILNDLDIFGFDWTVSASFNSFTFTTKMEEELPKAFDSFSCKNSEGRIITDFVASKIAPFDPKEKEKENGK